MYRPHDGPRFDYHEQEGRRVLESPTLAHQFPELKTLTVDLGHFNPKGVARNSQIKFQPNLVTAHTVFRIDCPNQGCIRGDFDLSKSLSDAVGGHKTTVTAELCCQGWLSKTTIDTVRCNNILRYTISLGY